MAGPENTQKNMSGEYESGSDLEDWNDYKRGGYYPVCLNQFFPNNKDGKFVILQKLGWGYFSTVWLVENRLTHAKYALKIQKGKPSYREAAKDEALLLKEISDNPNKNKIWELATEIFPNSVFPKNETFCIELNDWFEEPSDFGMHVCMLFPIMGPNLLDLIRYFDDEFESGIPVPLVKTITKQILLGLVYLHEYCKIIHTDLKPENVMLELNNEALDCIIKQVTTINKKPLSEKFWDSIHKNSKKTTKNQKKAAKKKLKKANQANEVNGTPLENSESSSSQIQNSNITDNEIMEGSNDAQSQSSKFLLSESENSNTQSILEKVNSSTVISELQSNLSPNPDSQVQMVEEINLLSNNAKDEFSPDISHNFDHQHQMIEETVVSNSIEIEKSGTISNDLKIENNDCTNHTAHMEQIISQETIDEEQKNNILEEKTNQDNTNKINYNMTWKNKVIVPINENMKVKLVDFGNGCWIHKHFTERIQTREYRSPEAILHCNYNETTDLWSLGCMIFEMLTSNFLFKPKKKDGVYKKNDDHLAMLIESFGKIPVNWAKNGKKYSNFFNSAGQLKNIKKVEPNSYPISESLITEFEFKVNEALGIEKFLLKMLQYIPENRLSARELLKDEWLNS